MQRAELEEARQREANETALLAIGPRKKMKTSANNASNSLTSGFNSPSNHITHNPSTFLTNSNKAQASIFY